MHLLIYLHFRSHRSRLCNPQTEFLATLRSHENLDVTQAKDEYLTRRLSLHREYGALWQAMVKPRV